MEQLSGRVAVVTGGASGIGRGMAEAFAAEGMSLVLADVEREPLATAAAELAGQGAKVVGVPCDVARPADMQVLAERTLSEYGAVHVLCNNAGVGGSIAGQALWERSLDEWDWVMGVNLMGVIHGIRSFLPAMLEQGDEGHVVNTASVAGVVPGAGIYGVTKHAVVALSESLWSDLAMRQSKVGVSVLCPGWVNTRIMESERNWPEAPRAASGEPMPGAKAVLEAVQALVRQGLDPVRVGELVVQAMRERRFYVFTHPHWSFMIRNRMENLLEGRDPTGVPPPPDESFELPGSD